MSIYRQTGEGLEAERIVCECTKVNDSRLIRLSGGHRGTRIIMSKYVYCVIETPLIRKS
jgi:hypothetical protein